MNATNCNQLSSLLEKLNSKSIIITYGEVPYLCKHLITSATELKRNKKYDEALSYYFKAIEASGQFTTEMGRMMTKVLCSMNEYKIALLILFACASVKWEYTVNYGFSISPFLSQKERNVMQKLMPAQTLPTASAADFFELRECIQKALFGGDLNPLFKRTKEVSGQQNYKNEKSDMEIINQLRDIPREFLK